MILLGANMQTAAVINFPATKVLDPHAVGAESWRHLKGNAKADRQHWRNIGESLLIGKREHPSDKLFGSWCRDMGYADISASVRSNAMWLAETWPTLQSLQGSDLSHPTAIRAAYNASLTPKAEAAVAAALAAYARILAASKMSREHWRLIGEALLEGRRQHATNRAFIDWCRAEGFLDLPHTARSDAVWLAENWDGLHEALDNSAYDHPTQIRADYSYWYGPVTPPRAWVSLHMLSHTCIVISKSQHAVMQEITYASSSKTRIWRMCVHMAGNALRNRKSRRDH
jgi:hypothetical protein